MNALLPTAPARSSLDFSQAGPLFRRGPAGVN